MHACCLAAATRYALLRAPRARGWLHCCVCAYYSRSRGVVDPCFESCMVRPCMHQRNPSSSHLRSCLSPAVRHASSRQIQPTDAAAAAAPSPRWRWRPPPQLSRHLRLTLLLCDRSAQLVAATPLQPARGCSSRMRLSVHGSAGVLLNEQLTGAHPRPLCHPPYLLCPP
eukprot:COSAG01_NODE_2850_length_6977_cov_8.906077_2_plen_169_part_00